MRDPDGRSLLTLEDLRYSTLPDLFRVTTQSNTLDIGLDLAVPDSLAGGTAAERKGTLSLERSGQPDADVWPTAADAVRTYGAKLAQATGLSMVDGLTSAGAVHRQRARAAGRGRRDLPEPRRRHLRPLRPRRRPPRPARHGGVGPDRVRRVPGDPPTGVAAPGDAVYCQATTADGLGAVTGATWTLHDQGTVAATEPGAIGSSPTGTVKITGSDGEPDLEVDFTAGGEPLTARSTPRTVQEVVDRVDEIEGSTASANLREGRLDVDVEIMQDEDAADLPLGNAGTLGALVGLTGLRSPDPDHPATARATAHGASFDVGFGIQTGDPAAGESRQTYLLPQDASLLRIDDLSASAPAGLTGLPARIGFLGVKADVTGLDLGRTGSGPAVTLDRVTPAGTAATDPLAIDDLFAGDGSLDPDQLDLTSAVTAAISFKATEQPVAGQTYATGTDGPASGSVSVAWDGSGLPEVTADAGYTPLRVFDPVPARFLGGTVRVQPGSGTTPDTVLLDVDSLPAGQTLYEALNVAPGSGSVEVARRLVSDGIGCQNVTLVDADTLTCDGFAPDGTAAWTDGAEARVVVLGDPFALRNSVIEGLASSLAEFDRIDGDNVTESPALAADQYTSTLPLVGLTPAQLAVERDALRTGLQALDKAATEDEQGVSATPVSTAQELTASIDDLVKVDGTSGDYTPSLDFTLGAQRLGVELVAHAPAGTQLQAPLRLDDVGSSTTPGRGQVSSGSTAAGPATVPVGVTSTTTLAITVDRATARPAVAVPTGTDSTATLSRTGAQLAGHPLDAGVGALTVQDAGSSADLGVRVRTEYADDGAQGGRFETRRTNARPSGPAAHADLTVGADDVISYTADATDSAGGVGATQPAPDPMQVQFLAEGLDGLSAALGSAMDGDAPRNLGPDGDAPISAPLIGTDLDAGAGVPDLLTDLTSSLRDQLETPAVSGAADAQALSGALDDAVATAVNGTAGLETVAAGDVTVTVTCGGAGGACTPCPAVDPTATPPAPPCTTDGPTGWDTITVATTLTGKEKQTKVPFETGLAGLEVRSDNAGGHHDVVDAAGHPAAQARRGPPGRRRQRRRPADRRRRQPAHGRHRRDHGLPAGAPVHRRARARRGRRHLDRDRAPGGDLRPLRPVRRRPDGAAELHRRRRRPG